MKRRTKIASLFLALCMVIGVLSPLQVQAASKTKWVQADETGYTQSSNTPNGSLELSYQHKTSYDKYGMMKKVTSIGYYQNKKVNFGTNQFKATYSKGKIKKGAYYEGGQKMYTTAYAYNKNGTVKSIKVKTTKNADTMYDDATITFSYKNKKLTKKVTKYLKYQKGASDTCYYYSNGEMKKMVRKYSDGSSSTTTYDKYGIPTSQSDSYGNKEKYKNTYKKGLCTQVTSNGMKAVYYITGYRAGQLKEMNYLNGDKRTYKYTQDKKSKQIATCTAYKDGVAVTKQVYKYVKVPSSAPESVLY